MLFYLKFHLGKNEKTNNISSNHTGLERSENTVRKNLWKSCRYTVSPHDFTNWETEGRNEESCFLC